MRVLAPLPWTQAMAASPDTSPASAPLVTARSAAETPWYWGPWSRFMSTRDCVAVPSLSRSEKVTEAYVESPPAETDGWSAETSAQPATDAGSACSTTALGVVRV